MKTQKDTIKQFLSDGAWVCGTEFIQNLIPEYRTRINELRRDGLEIFTRPCQQHQHKSKTLQEWRWQKPAPIVLPPAFVPKPKQTSQSLF